MLTRDVILEYIANKYAICPDYPWQDKPDYAVLRHQHNRKWFALILTVPAVSLGLSDTEQIDIVNLKCEPAVIDSLRQSEAIFPAYHMNKTHWFSLRLNSTFSQQQAYHLIDWSFDLTR
ncbi:MmcQ/YjbR family DNA-binding protein [Pasteurella oralis]|nr:MmcQ/YjbR family DNA-binding protein [Pasteurella oralis]